MTSQPTKKYFEQLQLGLKADKVTNLDNFRCSIVTSRHNCGMVLFSKVAEPKSIRRMSVDCNMRFMPVVHFANR